MSQRKIGKKALIARINYRLSEDGLRVYASRSNADKAAYGEGSYFIAHMETGRVSSSLASDSELETYAKGIGAMKQAETLLQE